MYNSEKKPTGYIDRSPLGFANRQGLSVSTVYKEIRTRKLKAKKIGSRTIITEQAESDWTNTLEDYPISA